MHGLVTVRLLSRSQLPPHSGTILPFSLRKCGGLLTSSHLHRKGANTSIETWWMAGGVLGRTVEPMSAANVSLCHLERHKLLVLLSGHFQHFLWRLANEEGLTCSIFFHSKDQLKERRIPPVPLAHSPYFYAAPKASCVSRQFPFFSSEWEIQPITSFLLKSWTTGINYTNR